MFDKLAQFRKSGRERDRILYFLTTAQSFSSADAALSRNAITGFQLVASLWLHTRAQNASSGTLSNLGNESAHPTDLRVRQPMKSNSRSLPRYLVSLGLVLLTMASLSLGAQTHETDIRERLDASVVV